jgi:hypothetical protein
MTTAFLDFVHHPVFQKSEITTFQELDLFPPSSEGGDLLEVRLRTTYFQAVDKFFPQKDGMAKGSSLSPIVSNIYMEHFEKLALNSAQDKP